MSTVAALKGVVHRLSLAHQFALFCLVVLVVGAIIIGGWVSREIEQGVIERTAAVTALYVDSLVRPHLNGLESGVLPQDEIKDLTNLLGETPLGQKIVSFKVWSPEGQVVYAHDVDLIGSHYAISGHLRDALSGKVASHLSSLSSDENRFERQQWSRLVETYSPVRSDEGVVIGAVEFYQLPGELLSQVRSSQRRGWLIVGVSTVAMYLLLVGLVAGASGTITRQNRGLQKAFGQQQALQARIRNLNQRLRQAASGKTQTDEELLRRLAQDLHDGPAQDLSLALLRIEALERADATEEERSTLSAIRFSLNHGLDEIRSMTTDLRLPQLEGLGWREVVEKAAAEHQRRTGSTVHLELGEVHPDPAPSQRIAVYRAVQEALTNAARHSGSAEQWVALVGEPGWCAISISDRGDGFDPGLSRPSPDRRARLGLQGMRERVELLGGSVSVRSASGRGTTVLARLPLDLGDSV